MQSAVLAGVSTRRVTEVPLPSGQNLGNGRSTVSKLWQKRAAELAEELQHSDLGQFDLLVLMLDAVVLDDGLVATVALGFDTEGRKQVLGYRVGSSDNAEVAKGQGPPPRPHEDEVDESWPAIDAQCSMANPDKSASKSSVSISASPGRTQPLHVIRVLRLTSYWLSVS